MYFQFDQTSDGRNLKRLKVIDEFTREALAIDIERSITGDRIIETLDRLVALRGAPKDLRFDSGPEFLSQVINEWAVERDVDLMFIEPGSQWQSAWIEPFNGWPCDACPDIEQFGSLLEAEVVMGTGGSNTTRANHPAGGNLNSTAYTTA